MDVSSEVMSFRMDTKAMSPNNPCLLTKMSKVKLVPEILLPRLEIANKKSRKRKHLDFQETPFCRIDLGVLSSTNLCQAMKHSGVSPSKSKRVELLPKIRISKSEIEDYLPLSKLYLTDWPSKPSTSDGKEVIPQIRLILHDACTLLKDNVFDSRYENKKRRPLHSEEHLAPLLKIPKLTTEECVSLISLSRQHNAFIANPRVNQRFTKNSHFNLVAKVFLSKCDDRKYLSRKSKARRNVRRYRKKPQEAVQKKVTTTTIVSNIFDTFFKDEIEVNSELKEKEKKRCGVCESCQKADCGLCFACLDMAKFGGMGLSEQLCIERRCSKMAGEDDKKHNFPNSPSIIVIEPALKWIGEGVLHEDKKYYQHVLVNKEQVNIGDYVKVCPTDPKVPLYICKVISMWENKDREMLFHGRWFSHCWDTILGYTGDPMELFLIDQCDDNPMGSVLGKCVVTHKAPDDGWSCNGGKSCLKYKIGKSGKENDYFYQMWYDDENARFELVKDYEKDESGGCISCLRQKKKKQHETPELGEPLKCSDTQASHQFFSSFFYRGVCYEIGDTVYLTPDAFDFSVTPDTFQQVTPSQKIRSNFKKKNEDIFPEYYRKQSSPSKRKSPIPAQPFRIGKILSIAQVPNVSENSVDIEVGIRKFYRPENTHKGVKGGYQTDYNLLYWSFEETTVKVEKVVRKCNVLHKPVSVSSEDDESVKQPDTFYFTKAYNSNTLHFEDIIEEAMHPLAMDIEKEELEGCGKTDPVRDNKFKKLKTLDLFAGCGGFSEGLHQAEVTETQWAIEVDEMAAQAFSMNHPNATVFNDDCNILLKQLMKGYWKNSRGQELPKKGDVDLIIGGPPCQGFSSLNRHQHGKNSVLKNSMIASFLSYCDFYRPKFLIMENIRNFLSHKKGILLKLTLRCLLKIGYQCTFTVLQCANYGIPQSRYRAILLGAAPGQHLPFFPLPGNSLLSSPNRRFFVDRKRYGFSIHHESSGIFRALTVRDGIFDLASVQNDKNLQKIPYSTQPQSHFQRQMRSNIQSTTVCDHYCREMSPLEKARIERIPHEPGADWRDLPNLTILLSNGKHVKKLVYTHDHWKNGPNCFGGKRGVCSCASGRTCYKDFRQPNTLIPWTLSHSADQNHNWVGAYGRLDWDGYFPTTTTYLRPSGNQGPVVHPSLDRVLSVRECARSQGFADSYNFFGSVTDKYRQIGNAVPPPLAKAIGLKLKEILH